MSISNAQLAEQISELLDYWRTRDQEFAAWLNGTPTGGPFSDGRYPLTDYLGVIQYLFSPAALESGVTSSASSAAVQAALAGASKDAALVAQAAAETARDLSLTYQTGSQVARDTALMYRDTAASHAANALVHRNKSKAWASEEEDVAVESGLFSARHYMLKTMAGLASIDDDVAAAAASADAAANSASDADAAAIDAAASALAAQTWNPANYLALAGGTMTGALTINVQGEGLTLKGNTTGAGSQSYVRFRDSANTAIGYVGDGSLVSTNIEIVSHSGAVELYSNNTLALTLGADQSATFTGVVKLPNNVWHTDGAGNHRLQFAASERSYYKSPVTGAVGAHEFRNGSDAPVFGVRADGWTMLHTGIYNAFGAGQYFELAKNDSYTHGSMRITGARNGYHGLVVEDSAVLPTFMSDGTHAGIYNQGHSQWMVWTADTSYVRTSYKWLNGNTGRPYLVFDNHATAAGGRITVSTSGPSGTPEDGDIWIQRAA